MGFTSGLGSQLASIRTQLGELHTKVGELDTKLDTKVGELDTKLDTKLGELDTKLDTKLGELDTKLGELRSEVGELDAKISAGFAAELAGQEATYQGLRRIAAAGAAPDPRMALADVRLPAAMFSAAELRPLLIERGLRDLTETGAPLGLITGAQLFSLTQDNGELLASLRVPKDRMREVQRVLMTVLSTCTVSAADGTIRCS